MKTRFTVLPVLATIALTWALADASVNGLPRGVAPSRINLYTSNGAGKWGCLDGSKSIPYTAINDDYCDCPDGSDEPGTSACGSGYFYCLNTGHIPSYIRTSRLNDGICDIECCDGSDEFNGAVQCPNVCEQVGKEAKEERDRVRKAEIEGGKIKEGYIAYGKGAKKRLQEQLANLKAKFAVVQQRASDTKAAFDEANALREKYLQRTKTEREAARKVQLAPMIEEQSKRLAHAIDIKSGFRATLEELKEKYNKNYHDLAVKDAITGFDEYLKELEQEAKNTVADELQDTERERTADEHFHAVRDQTRVVHKEIGRMFQLLKIMKKDHNVEYNDEAVLKAIKHLDDFAPTWQDNQNEFVGEELVEIPKDKFEASEQREVAPLCRFNCFILLGDDIRMQAIDSKNDTFYSKFRKAAEAAGLGFMFGSKKTEWERTQESYSRASETERKLQSEIQDLEQKLSMDYGKDETFAQLADKCFEYKDMDSAMIVEPLATLYYSKFSNWIGDNYDTQLYTGGTKCWNGPERSVKVAMSCGVVNEIVAVSEPSKCEYLYKFRTPAACRLISDKDVAQDADIIREAVMPGEAIKKHDEL
ncbi:hypothetical protein EC968_006371 [Mortierella alpina]|nr:hypothetical protein EC968_006371 [Mortierella alpina]